MKQSFRGLQAIIILLLTISVIGFGCRENTLINSRVSPSNNADSVYAIALPCITHTYYSDSVITSTNIGGIPVFQAVGAMADPYFGTMTGATYFQVVPTNADTNIYTGKTIDSAVLVLPYSGYTYGSTAADSMAAYQVFYMDDTINFYNTYYAFTSKAIDGDFPLSAPTTFNIAHLGDSILVSSAHHSGLRIKLNLQLLMSHISPALISVSSSGNIQDFISSFHGICVRAADNRQLHSAIPYFELNGADAYSEAGILVYYHKTGVAGLDSVEPYHFNSSLCAHFNNVSKSYTRYPVNGLIHSARPNDEIIALQNQPGPGIDIVIPGIRSIPAGIISKASIQFTILPAYTNTVAFTYPENLFPIGIASVSYHPLGTTYAGEPYTVLDRYPVTSTTPLNILDGTMHSITTAGIATSTYTIDIPREVIASAAAKNDTLHYHITGTQDFYGAFHMVAGGGAYGMSGTADTLYRAKIIIVYSKLTK